MKFLDKLLDYYKLDTITYQNIIKKPSLIDVPNYNVFNNMELVSNRIKNAIKSNQKILIYGDYDADGILATSILSYTLNKLNANYSYYIPSRYLDSYGLNEEKIKIAKEKGFNLIITVDNGVSALDAINLSIKLGIDIIITDHHEFNWQINTPYFLHPRNSTLSVTTSGASVAFYLSCSLLNMVDPYLLTLAGISIISDVMPMKNENRIITKLAIELLNKNKYKQITIFSGQYEFDENILSSSFISKVNGIGRICQGKEANNLVKLFICDDFKTIYNIRDFSNNIDNEKKKILADILKDIKIDENESVIVLKLNCLLGLGSILSTRFCLKYNKPAAIFIKNNDIYKGSIRSKKGLDLFNFNKENKDLYIKYGGHHFASGIEIKEENIDLFKNRLITYYKSHPFEKEESIEINIDEINKENMDTIKLFSPFGGEFNAPRFILRNVPLTNIIFFGSKKEHLKIIFPNFNLVWFYFNRNLLNNKSSFDFIGKLKIDKYKEKECISFLVE